MKIVLVVAALLASGVFYFWGSDLQFLAGGALVNLGYRMQDHLADYDFQHHEATAPEVWEEFLKQNRLASGVRSIFPRSSRHPVIALVACMDARMDTNEIAGDTRRYYYVLRLAGSALSVKEEEMLELAVANGVKVIVFTTHTDCAAEKVAADPNQRRKYPSLSQAVDERAKYFNEFLRRPAIRTEIAQGKLLVKWMDLDTRTEEVIPHDQANR